MDSTRSFPVPPRWAMNILLLLSFLIFKLYSSFNLAPIEDLITSIWILAMSLIIRRLRFSLDGLIASVVSLLLYVIRKKSSFTWHFTDLQYHITLLGLLSTFLLIQGFQRDFLSIFPILITLVPHLLPRSLKPSDFSIPSEFHFIFINSLFLYVCLKSVMKGPDEITVFEVQTTSSPQENIISNMEETNEITGFEAQTTSSPQENIRSNIEGPDESIGFEARTTSSPQENIISNLEGPHDITRFEAQTTNSPQENIRSNVDAPIMLRRSNRNRRATWKVRENEAFNFLV